MEVILLQQVRRLGKPGEIVSVKNGYGRNYLLPQKIAIRANEENVQNIKAKKVELEKQNQEAKKVAEALSKKIEGKNFVFIKQCGDDGRLFGSVASKEVAAILSEELKTEVPQSSVYLSTPLKNLGIYEVMISLHADVSCNVLINVARTESEATDALIEFKEGPKEEAKSEAEIAAEMAAAQAEAEIAALEDKAESNAEAYESDLSEEVSEEATDSEDSAK